MGVQIQDSFAPVGSIKLKIKHLLKKKLIRNLAALSDFLLFYAL